MAKDPTFPFYASDWLIDTIRWTRDMQGLHVCLLAESWANGGLQDEAGKPLGLGSTDVEIWLKIKHKWVLKNGQWFSDKLEEVRAARIDFKKKQSEKGILSAKKRKSQSTKHQPNINHGSTKVEPIESESEKEIESELKNNKEFDFKKPDIEGDDIIFPVDTPAVRELWANWKKYRWRQHEARYGMMGEQADLKRLEKMNYAQMEDTVLTAIAGKWKNLYPDKNGNGKTNTTANNKQQRTASMAEYLREHYSDKPTGS